MKKTLIIIVMSLSLFSCNQMTKETNDAEDLSNAKMLTEDFYKKVQAKKHSDLLEILDPKLDTNYLGKMLRAKDSLFGLMTHYKIDKVETIRIDTSNVISVDYYIEADTYYDGSSFHEILNFQKRGESDVILTGYNYKTVKRKQI